MKRSLGITFFLGLGVIVAFGACSDSKSGGSTGGAGGTAGGFGGFGGNTDGGGAVGGGGTGGTGATGGSTSASCQGNCGSSQPVPNSSPECYCDDLCEQNNDCCDDKATVCQTSSVQLPAGCVVAGIQVQCNPVTNEGCGNGGAACDLGTSNNQTTIQCFPDGNTAQPGASCDNGKGPWCIPTHHCTGSAGSATCKKFCCAASDCATGESCAPFDPQLGTLGTCAGSGDGGTGDGGSTDGGGSDAAAADASTD